MNDKREKRTTSEKSKTGASSRRKGASGEREFIHEVQDRLGNVNLKRNLDQWREGGYDIDGLDHLAIEIKRYEKINFGLIREWWNQTIEQAIAHRRVPVLAYRADHQPWRVRVPISFLRPDLPSLDINYTIEIQMDLFCCLVRESMLDIGVADGVEITDDW